MGSQHSRPPVTIFGFDKNGHNLVDPPSFNVYRANIIQKNFITAAQYEALPPDQKKEYGYVGSITSDQSPFVEYKGNYYKKLNEIEKKAQELRAKYIVKFASAMGIASNLADVTAASIINTANNYGKEAARSMLPRNVDVDAVFATLDQSVKATPSARDEVLGSAEYIDQAQLKHIAGSCGCDGFVGAAEGVTVSDYTGNEPVRQRLLSQIVAALKAAGFSVDESKNLQAQLKALSEELVKKGSVVPERHADACAKLADIFNKSAGETIIDPNLPPEEICRRAVSHVISLAAGTRAEFLAIYAAAKRSLLALHYIGDAMDQLVLELQAGMAGTGDDAAIRIADEFAGNHRLVREEAERQISIMANMLDITLTPAEKDLASMVKRVGIFGKVNDSDFKLGTDKFGKLIWQILNGLAVTGFTVKVTQDALQVVGKTLDEYANIPSSDVLRRDLLDKLPSDPSKREEYIEAVDFLVRKAPFRKSILQSAQTGKVVLGQGEKKGGKFDVEKKIEDKNRLLRVTVEAFYRRVNDILQSISSSLLIASTKIASAEIPLSSQLVGFRDALVKVNREVIRNKKAFYALAGYYSDAISKSVKETFLSQVQIAISFLGDVLDSPLYSKYSAPFKDIKAGLQSLIDLIEKYSTEVTERFGSGGYYEDNIDGGSCCLSSGGADRGSHSGGSSDLFDPVYLHKTTKSFADAVTEFGYSISVGQIKENLKTVSKNLEDYGKDYALVVNTSVEKKLHEIKQRYEAYKKMLDSEKIESSEVANMRTASELSRDLTEAKRFLQEWYECKVDFWKAVVAVDQYLKLFTDAVIRNPDDIKSIRSMIDDVETINGWYTESTGNILASVFDYFQTDNQYVDIANNASRADVIAAAFPNRKTQLSTPPDVYTESGENVHTYKRIEEALKSAARGKERYATPGLPGTAIWPSVGIKAVAKAGEGFRRFGALKNMLSIFVYLGGRIGSGNIDTKTLLSPSKIYQSLISYLSMSAFSQGIGLGNVANEKFENDNNYKNSLLAYNPKVNAVREDLHTDLETMAANDRATLTTGNPDQQNLAGQFSVVDYKANGCTINTSKAAVGQGYEINTYSSDPDRPSVILGTGAIHLPVDVYNGGVIADGDNLKGASLAKFVKKYGVWMRLIPEEIKRHEALGWKEEDEYFTYLMKAIAGKIFTVTGMIDLFEKPLEANLYTPVRFLVGASEPLPTVDENYVELYVRTIQLMMFYKQIFGYGDEKSWHDTKDSELGGNTKITIVPDIGGNYDDLIRLAFRKISYDNTSNLSDEEIKEIIRCVNKFAAITFAKYPDNPVMETINEIVNEINRRYMIVSEDEYRQWNEEFTKRFDYASLYSKSDGKLIDSTFAAEYPLLPGEETEENDMRIGDLSGPFVKQSLDYDKADRFKALKLTKQYYEIIRKFRCRLESKFNDATSFEGFSVAIKSAQMKLKRETNSEERFKIVAQLIRGNDIYTQTDVTKYMIFHEFIVSGLDLLSTIHTLLYSFKKRVLALNLEWLTKQVQNYIASSTATDITMEKIVAAIKVEFDKIRQDNDDDSATLFEEIFGKYEGLVSRGGSVLLNTGAYYGMEAINGSRANLHKDTSHIDASNANLAVAAGNCLFGILNGVSKDELRKYPIVDDRVKTFFSYLFDKQHMMKEMVECTFGIGSSLQDLVSVRFDDGKVYLNYSELKSSCELLFTSILNMSNLLRPYIRTDLFDKYFGKTVPGSYYWLQEQLMEKILVGRSELSESDPNYYRYANLDAVNRIINGTLGNLSSKLTVSATGTGANPAGVSLYPQGGEKGYELGDVFAQLIFYDANYAESGVVRSSMTSSRDTAGYYYSDDGLLVSDFKTNVYDAMLVDGKGNLDTRFVARFHQLYTWKEEFTYNQSLLFAFNQVVAKYLQTCFDPATQKIFAPAIENFTSGTLNSSILEFKKTYPDVAPSISFSSEKRVAAGVGDSINVLLSSGRMSREDVGDVYELLKIFVGIKNIPISNIPVKNFLTAFSADSESVIKDLKRGPSPNPPGLDVKVIASTYYTILAGYAAIEVRLKEYNHNANKAMARDIVMLSAPYAESDAIGKDDITDTSGDNPSQTIALFANLFNINENCVVANHDTDTVRAPVLATAADEFARLLGLAQRTRLVLTLMGTPVPLNNQAPILLRFLEAMKAVNGTLMGDPKHEIGEQIIRLTNALILIAQSRDLPTANGYANNADYLGKTFGTALPFVLKQVPYIANGDVSDDNLQLLAGFLALYERSIYDHAANGQLLTFGADLKPDDTLLQKKASEVKQPGPTQYGNVVMAKHIMQVDTSVYNKQGRPASDTFIKLASKDSTDPNMPSDPWGILGSSPSGKEVSAVENLADILQFGRRADPDGDHVLFTSLAICLRNLLTSKKEKEGRFVESVADLPGYMKEKMRGNLPVLINMLRIIGNKCAFLKRILTNYPNLNLERSRLAGRKDLADPWPFVLQPVPVDSKGNRDRFLSILTSLEQGAQSLSSSAEAALKAIGDSPLYLEVYEDFIRDYRNHNGFEPFMPLSTSLYFLRNLNTEEDGKWILPVHGYGNPGFQWTYGTRALINKTNLDVTMEHLPGVKGLINFFNITVDSKSQIQDTLATQYTKSFTRLVRYSYELRQLKRLLTPYISTGARNPNDPKNKLYSRTYEHDGAFYREMVVFDGKDIDGADVPNFDYRTNNLLRSILELPSDSNLLKPVYPLGREVSIVDVMQLTTSSMREEKIREIANHVSEAKRNVTDLALYNIIDLNIVPVNVNALMREVPLANIYNYSFTFERLVADVLYNDSKQSQKTVQSILKELCADPAVARIESAKDILFQLIRNPYLEVNGGNFTHLFHMVVGNISSSLVRPRFISDQLWNKMFLQNLYAGSPNLYSDTLTGHGTGIKADQLKAIGEKVTVDLITNILANYNATFTTCRVMAANSSVADIRKQVQNVYSLFNPADSIDSKIDQVAKVASLKDANDTSHGRALVIIITFFVHALNTGFGPGGLGWITKYLTKSITPATFTDGVNEILAAISRFHCLNVGHYFGLQNPGDPFGGPPQQNTWQLAVTGKFPLTMDLPLRTSYNGDIASVAGNLTVIAGDIPSFNLITRDATPSLGYYNQSTDLANLVRDTEFLNRVDIQKIETEIYANGLTRLNSVFARNLLFLSLLYRLVRHKLQTDLTYTKDIISKSEAITDPSLTEFYGARV